MRVSAGRALPEELTDGRIVLRMPTLDDVWDFHEAATESLDELIPWLGWAHEGFAREEVEDWIFRALDGRATGQMYEFFIRDAGDGSFVGAGGLNRVDPGFRKANCGYWIRTSRTTQGFASAAVRLIAGFAFEHLALERVEVVAAVENRASQRAAEKAGATREGMMRRGIRVREKQQDAVLYSLIPGDV